MKKLSDFKLRIVGEKSFLIEMIFAREIKPDVIGAVGGFIHCVEDEFAFRKEGLVDFGEGGF